jgi:hypothetical protein
MNLRVSNACSPKQSRRQNGRVEVSTIEFRKPNLRRSEIMKTIRSYTRLLLLSCLFGTAAALMSASSHAANGSVAYTYDALGRVTTASYDTGACIIYSYDPNGNRLSETINVTTSGTAGVWGCFNWNASGGAVWD